MISVKRAVCRYLGIRNTVGVIRKGRTEVELAVENVRSVKFPNRFNLVDAAA
jgi:hypothetical protein